MTWRWIANRRPPHRISSPPHAQLQIQAPKGHAATQAHPGWWLGRFHPTHA
ncbi:hypothetical protein Hanom_Chr04g00372851 [Helianthus anomalus]